METETGTILAVDEETEQLSVPDAEVVPRSFDQELYDLIEANADVIVYCPWEDREMALSPAILCIPIEIKIENYEEILALAHGLLASRVEKPADQEENESEKTKEEPKAEKAEVKIEQVVEADAPKKDKDKTKTVDLSDVSEVLTQVEPAVVEQVAQAPELTSTHPLAKVEEISESAEVKNIVTPSKVEAHANKDKVQTEVSNEADEAKQVTNYEVPQIIVEQPKPNDLEAVEIEEVTLPEVPSTDALIETFEPELIAEVALETNTAEVEYENPEPEETIITSQFRDIFESSDQEDIINTEEITAADSEIAITKEVIDQMTERIQEVKQETAESAFEILDQIAELSAKLELSENEDTANEEEDLKELFIELLSELEIDYTEEMIEALILSKFRQHLVAETSALEDEEETDEETSAHAVAKKQVAILVTIKRAMMHAYAIGRSALRLYKLSFSV